MSTKVIERCPNCEAGSGEPGQHCGGQSRNCYWWKCPSCRATIGPEAYFLSAEDRELLPEGDNGTRKRGAS